MKNILLIFTGGTICSCASEQTNKNQSCAKQTSFMLVENYKNSASPVKDEIEFIPRFLKQDILSENMTVDSINEIIDIFRDKKTIDACKGVIILHGTDTLAYTSSILAVALAGINVPVCLVSAQLDLKQPKTNGFDNFRASVELIANGICPNVYVVYRNLKNKNHDPGDMLVHYGAHLQQCPNYSNNFYSVDQMLIKDTSNAKLKGRAFETNDRYFEKFKKLTQDVMLIMPYTNLRYTNISLDGVCAIVHGTYHSQSVCIGRVENAQKNKEHNVTLEEVLESDRPYSILTLIKACKEKNIPVILSPCNEEEYTYSTTANALFAGALAIANTTFELAQAKVILGCSLNKKDAELKAFLKKSINYEFVY